MIQDLKIVRKWINSCTTLQQLKNIERFINNYLSKNNSIKVEKNKAKQINRAIMTTYKNLFEQTKFLTQ